MCEAMSEALLDWRDDDSVEAVVIDHAEGRGFCAGGDVVDARAAAATRTRARRKRLLLRRISPQPPAVHLPQADRRDHGRDHDGRRRRHLAARATSASRPRTRASPCPRPASACSPTSAAAGTCRACPGGSAQFMALTGARLDGAECHYLGLATHYVEQSALDGADRADRQDARARPGADRRVRRDRRRTPRSRRTCRRSPAVRVRPARGHPRRARGGRQRLGDDRAGDAADARARCRARSRCGCSPKARPRAASPTRCAPEYALAGRVVRTHDFREGVRALLIDKDNAPQWDPPTPEEVTDEMLDVLFAAAARDRGAGRRSRRPKQ